MKIWTIQTKPVVTALEKNGVYRPDPLIVMAERICADDLKPDEDPFYQSYLWIADQMEKRIPPRPKLGPSWPDTLKAMPIWGWHQWNGPKEPKPDLRHSGHLKKGTVGYRLELDIDPSKVLLSDFDLWFFPFDGIYLGKNMEEDRKFEKDRKAAGCEDSAHNLCLPVPLQARLHKSWERVFDLNFYRSGYNCGKKEKVVQATFWEIRQEDVRNITRFTAR